MVKNTIIQHTCSKILEQNEMEERKAHIQMMSPFQLLNVSWLAATSDRLRILVGKSFGPNGQICLILQATGHPLMTMDGTTLLENCNFTDPMTRYIAKSAISFQELTGDGSKQFILLLAELVKCIDEFVTSEYGQNSFAEKKALCQKLSRGLLEISNSILPNCLEFIKADALLPCTQNQMKLLVQGFFQGKFANVICRALVELTLKFIQQTDEQFTVLNFDFLIQNFPLLCLPVEGLSIEYSYTGCGFVVTRDLATPLESTMSNSDLKFVLLNCSLGLLEENPSSAIIKNNPAYVTKWSEGRLEDIITHYKTNSVKLVLSTEPISDVALFLCRKQNILVMHSIDKDEAAYIQSITSINPITNCFTILDSDNIGIVKCLKLIQIGKSRYVQFEFLPSKNFLFQERFVVLCGPTLEFSKQYARTILNCLKTLKLWALSKQSVPTGGRWELLISKRLSDCSQSMTGDSKHACELLSKAMLSVPKIILQNSNATHSTAFVEVFHEIQNNVHKLLSINCSTGKVIECKNECKLESVEVKYQLIKHVVSAVYQLLKIDSIQRVKKL